MTRIFLCKQEVRRWCVWCERRASSSTLTSRRWSTFPSTISSRWWATPAAWSGTAAAGYERQGPSARRSLTWDQGKLAEKPVCITKNKIIVSCWSCHDYGPDLLPDRRRSRLQSNCQFSLGTFLTEGNDPEVPQWQPWWEPFEFSRW